MHALPSPRSYTWPGQAPASEVAGGSTGEHTIVFRFMPRYPLTLVCEPSNCLARLPSSRQVRQTLRIVSPSD